MTMERLIMVEDDAGHAALIQKNLQRAGVAKPIVHLQDGAEALEYFFHEGKTTDAEKQLVLLDLNLPKVDGYEVLRRLKEDEKTRNIPVIILTTTDNPREVNRCYEMGCNVYITKPISYENFSDSIRKLGLMVSVVKVPITQH